MSNSKSQRGNGRFYTRNGILWVEGTVEGKFYRKSTGKRASKLNLAWAEKQRPIDVLSKIIDNVKTKVETIDELDFEKFAYRVLEASSQSRGKEVQEDYENILRKFILPYFKNFPLDKIKPLDIEAWQNPKTSSFKHLSFDRRKRIRGVLNLILSSAQKNLLIQFDPSALATKVAKTNEELEKEDKVIIYSTEEVRKIFEVSSGWLRLYFMISFMTGLRVGEILGLKWTDFDFEDGILYLQRSRTHGKEKGSTRTKNHKRQVVLFPQVLEELKRVFSEPHRHEEYVFVSRLNKPWYNSRHMIAKHVKPLFKEHGITYRHLKTTRANFITAMIKSAVSISWVQQQVGHSKKSSITIKHYFEADETIAEKKEIGSIASEKFSERLGIAKSA